MPKHKPHANRRLFVVVTPTGKITGSTLIRPDKTSAKTAWLSIMHAQSIIHSPEFSRLWKNQKRLGYSVKEVKIKVL